MPLVFVHGVNVRYDSNDDPLIVARDALFRRLALTRIVKHPNKSTILNPYWGDVAARFPYGHGGLPAGTFEAFGGDDRVALGALSEITAHGDIDPANTKELDPDCVVLRTAEFSLERAVDALWSTAALDIVSIQSDALADLGARVAEYAQANPHATWIDEVKTDEEFVQRLIDEALQASPPAMSTATEVQAFGLDEIRDRIRHAVSRIRNAVVGTRDTVLATAGAAAGAVENRIDRLLLWVRTPVHRSIATFLGDIFVWQRQREEHRTEIADRVAAALTKGAALREETGEPLIVVAHSMGGNVTYDLLTSRLRDLTVDAFVTVGSQVAVLEELRLFESSDADVPNGAKKKVPKPANVACWLNVFDTTDILGFAAGRVFDNVEDFTFRTGHAWAHGGYFVEPTFHHRLGARLAEMS